MITKFPLTVSVILAAMLRGPLQLAFSVLAMVVSVDIV
tara:strand:+ start:1644 stop:1757 length:114 start_codon:yes stop_codon:yes gene_type:complete